MSGAAFALALLISVTPPPMEPEVDGLAPLHWTQFAIPALEDTVVSLSLLSFSALVTRQPFALLSGESVARNLQPSSWTFDVDYYVTNQFGHPYQGGWYFQAARSSGLGFWWSAAYATFFSLVWELCFETEPPSVNDQITTPLGGSMLGEALHRASLRLRRAGGPRWLTLLGATLLDPLASLNAALLGEPTTLEDALEPMFVRWQAGAATGRVIDRTDLVARDTMPVQAFVSVHLVSGPPWDELSRYELPLSYFDLRADLSFPFKVVGDLFIRGLVVGQRFGAPRGRVRGVWGLLGAYDYAAPALVRASAVGLGPGFALGWEPGAQWSLQAGGFLGASPLAAAGQLLDVSPDEGRDYQVGPGVQSVLELRVFRPRWLLLELTVRHWLVVGTYTPPHGYESIVWTTVGLHVPVWRWLALGGEATLSDRRATVTAGVHEHDTGLTVRVMLSVFSEPLFGLHPERAP